MKKCILIPDSFKGTMSSIEICCILSSKIKKYYPDCQIISIPAADGGEGTADCFLTALHGEKIVLSTSGPFGAPTDVYYVKDGDTAIVEMAQAAGLPLAEKLGRKDPGIATTYGVGNVIAHAVKSGCKKIILGLGGSCTNDCGTGMAAALGAKFFNKAGKSFLPNGETLSQISSFDLSRLEETLHGCEVIAMCDIDNPLYGENGAAYVFAPQKGADAEQVARLDQNLRIFAQTVKDLTGKEIASLPGAGAAGGMGAGVSFFLGGKLQSGIEIVLDLVGFDQKLAGTDMIFTGEGKIDCQSLRGKVVIGVTKRAAPHQVPVTAIVGDVGTDAETIYNAGVTAVFSINQTAVPFSEARKRCQKDLSETFESVLRYQKSLGK